MKKILVLGSMILAVLGIVAVAQAAAPMVYAGNSQTITLPTSSVTLSGSATITAPATIVGYSWVQTSGPVTSVIATPTAASTVVTGLTSPGNYVFTLSATDNSAPGQTGFSSVNVTVNMNQNPLPVINNNTKMKLEINPKGQVNLQGVIDSINGNNLVIKVWGLTFNVNTTNAKFGSIAQNVGLYKVGDYVGIQGNIDTTTSSPTINAKKVSNVNIRNIGDRKDREDDWKDNGKMDGSFKGIFKNIFSKGGDNGKGRDGDR